MAWTIKLRRGTSSEWSDTNPVLADGEPAYDETAKALKVGDGTTAWADLDPLGNAAGGEAPDATTSSKGIVQLAGDLGGTAASPTVPALAEKAPLASPAFTGTPTTASTPTAGDNSTKLATTAFVGTAVANAALLTTTTKTANYTLVLADGGTLIELNASSGVTLTVPPNSSVAFPTGTVISVRQYGVGQVTVAAGAGVTIRSRGSLSKLAGQYAEAMLTKRATDEWVLTGDLVA